MSKQPLYGFPCVTDPRDFIPDCECCGTAELEAHKQACETFGTPKYVPNKGCFSQYDDAGQFVRHVTRTSWGIGTNLVLSCDRCGEPAFDGPLITCYECGGQDFCTVCWPEHEKEHEDGRL